MWRKGFLWRNSDGATLITAIRTINKTGEYQDKKIPDLIAKIKRNKKKRSILTKREREILMWIAKGYSNEAIAKKLYLSRRTVENHRQHIMAKLEVKNSSSLISYAIQLGLTMPQSDA